MTFRGKVALITGAGSGMGQLSAWRLAADSAVVAAVDVSADGLARTVRNAPSIRAFECDVSDADAVADLVKQVEHELGPIDRVVNAAAIAPTRKLVEQPVEQIRRVMEINYFGVVNVTMATLPAMVERQHGELVQYGSLAGWLPSQTFGAYSATKAAVVSFTETLYHELGAGSSGVRIVCVCPPVVDTPLLDQIGTHGPKDFEKIPKLAPEVVLDAVEEALDAGRLFAFPGRGTSTLWRMRRFAPQLLWKRIDRMERG